MSFNRNDDALPKEPNYRSKPEIDLQSWIALGSNAKPSRTDRRQKRGWKRGGI